MSGARRVVMLLVGIVVAVAAHWALDMKDQSAPRALRRNALFPDAEKATAISVARAGEPETKLANGSAWEIVSPFVARAERRAVLRLIDALAYAPISDEMTDGELLKLGRTRSDFGLDRPRLVVTVGGADANGSRISFGSATPAGDGVYAAVGRSDTVYVVSSNAFVAADIDAAGFRCRRVFDMNPDDVSAFDIKTGVGRFFRFVREGEAWKLSEPYESVVSSARVRAFFDTLHALEAKDFVRSAGVSNEVGVVSASLLAGYGLDPESSVTVSAKAPGGAIASVSFGREASDGLVYALANGCGSVMTVSAAVREAAIAGIDTFVDARLFPLDAAAVTMLALNDGETDYLLSRRADGAWRLDAPVSAAADGKSVDKLVARLLELRKPDADENGIRVSVGTNVAPVSVSRSALFADLRKEDLRSREILKMDAKSVKRLVVTDDGTPPVAVVFDAERRVWTIESADASVVADGEAIARLVDALNPLLASRIERLKVSVSDLDAFGLGKPLRTVAIDQLAEDSVRRNILVGDVADGGRFATLGSSDAVFVISPESAAALLAPIAK